MGSAGVARSAGQPGPCICGVCAVLAGCRKGEGVQSGVRSSSNRRRWWGTTYCSREGSRSVFAKPNQSVMHVVLMLRRVATL